MRSRRLLTVALCCVFALAATLTPNSASATKIEDLRTEAKRIAAQIGANGDRIAALGEHYNGAQLKLNAIHEQQGVAVRRLADATQQAAKLRKEMVGIASRLYVTSGSTGYVTISRLDRDMAAAIACRIRAPRLGAAAAGVAAAGVAGAARFASEASWMSRRCTRPSGPVPATVARSTCNSAAS